MVHCTRTVPKGTSLFWSQTEVTYRKRGTVIKQMAFSCFAAMKRTFKFRTSLRFKKREGEWNGLFEARSAQCESGRCVL